MQRGDSGRRYRVRAGGGHDGPRVDGAESTGGIEAIGVVLSGTEREIDVVNLGGGDVAGDRRWNVRSCQDSMLRGGRARRNERDHLRAAGEFDRAEQEAAADDADQSAGGDGMKRLLTPEDGMDAADEFRTPLPCSEGKRLSTALEGALGEAGETGGVSAGSLGAADDAFVAGHLALAAEAVLDPCERGVQREKNQGKLLQQIGPVVAAAQVLRFMEDNVLEFAGREALKEPVGDEDARCEEADDAGAVKQARGADLNRTTPRRDGGKKRTEARIHRNRSGGPPKLTQAQRMEGKIGGTIDGSEEPESSDGECPTTVELERSFVCNGPKRGSRCYGSGGGMCEEGPKWKSGDKSKGRGPEAKALRGGDTRRKAHAKG